MAASLRSLIQKITVDASWDRVIGHPVECDVNIDLVGLPGEKVPILRCIHPHIVSVNILRITDNEQGEQDAHDVGSSCAPPPPDNTLARLYGNHAPRGHAQLFDLAQNDIGPMPIAFDPNLSLSKLSPSKKDYLRGTKFSQDSTRKRLFPPSPSSRGASLGFSDLPSIKRRHSETMTTTRALRESTNRLSPPKVAREFASASSKFSRSSDIERDSHGFCKVPVPREPSAETVDIVLSTAASSDFSSETTVITNRQQGASSRPFSPVVDTTGLRVYKREGRDFANESENKPINPLTTPPSRKKNKDQFHTPEPSPSKIPMKHIPARTSSRIPVACLKKNREESSEAVRPRWQNPGIEDIGQRPRSPGKFNATSRSPTRSPQTKAAPPPGTPKRMGVCPPLSPTKGKQSVTPPKKKLESKSLDNLSSRRSKHASPNREGPTYSAKTVGRMMGARLLEPIDRGTDSTEPLDPLGGTVFSTKIADNVAHSRARLNTADDRPSSTIDSIISNASATLYPYDSDSNYDTPQRQDNSDSDSPQRAFLPPSPTPSSQLIVPWTATQNLMAQSLYCKPEELVASGEASGPFPNTTHQLTKPSVESENGFLAVHFLHGCDAASYRVSLKVHVSPNQKGFGGWHSITIPGLPTQEAEWGCVRLQCKADYGPSKIEFCVSGVSEPNVEGASIKGFFDHARPFQVDVRTRQALREIREFQVQSEIHARYQWEEERGLWIHYTATCALKDFDDNFAADQCRFTLRVHNAPTGIIYDALRAGHRTVYLERDSLSDNGQSFAGMRICLISPTDELQHPFTLSWRAHPGRPPFTVSIPKITPGATESPSDVKNNVSNWVQTLPLRPSPNKVRTEGGSGDYPGTWPKKQDAPFGSRLPLLEFDHSGRPWNAQGGQGHDRGSSAGQVTLKDPHEHKPSHHLVPVKSTKQRTKKSTPRYQPRNTKDMSSVMDFDEEKEIVGLTTQYVDTQVRQLISDFSDAPELVDSSSPTPQQESEVESDSYFEDYVQACGEAVNLFMSPISTAYYFIRWLASGLICFVVIFFSPDPAMRLNDRPLSAAARYAFRLVDVVVGVTVVSCVLLGSYEIAPNFTSPWVGTRLSIDKGMRMTKIVVDWVKEKSYPIVQIGIGSEECVKTLIEGIVPDDMPTLEKGVEKEDTVGPDESEDVKDETVTTTEVSERLPATDVPVLDWIDWALGWKMVSQE